MKKQHPRAAAVRVDPRHNTFATSLTQRPIDLGIDLVFHSATRALSGPSDIIARALLDSTAMIDRIWSTATILGPSLARMRSCCAGCAR
ncbi:MAG TPA: PLP-dependent transferase [Thermoanaerobaculia bacterium]|nr:PLP-dependent transferase [Thermoanaerobaculia bacterium]